MRWTSEEEAAQTEAQEESEMKNLIVIIGCILLGAIIFDMMAGSSPDSLKSVSGRAIVQTMEAYG